MKKQITDKNPQGQLQLESNSSVESNSPAAAQANALKTPSYGTKGQKHALQSNMMLASIILSILEAKELI